MTVMVRDRAARSQLKAAERPAKSADLLKFSGACNATAATAASGTSLRSSVFAASSTEAIKAGKRPALELATGGGKTIVAFLAAALLGARTLFLAPTKPLIAQHNAFLKNEMGHKYSTRVIDGNTKKGERIWDCARETFVFATPEVVLAAMADGATIFANFTLVVFDEVHHARGGYAYVEIGRILREMPWELNQAESAIAHRTWDQLTRDDRELARFDGRVRERHVRRLEKLYDEWLAANVAEVCGRVRNRFREHLQLANLANSQLSSEQRELVLS